MTEKEIDTKLLKAGLPIYGTLEEKKKRLEKMTGPVADPAIEKIVDTVEYSPAGEPSLSRSNVIGTVDIKRGMTLGEIHDVIRESDVSQQMTGKPKRMGRPPKTR